MPRKGLIGCLLPGLALHSPTSPVESFTFVFFLDAEQVGTGWLNPTEDVWPLEETLQVAQLAFQGLNTSTSGDGECMRTRLKACTIGGVLRLA